MGSDGIATVWHLATTDGYADVWNLGGFVEAGVGDRVPWKARL